MKEYGLIVIGAGSGLDVAAAASRKWKVALVEEGPLGGTCLNRGCIPTKILAHIAEVIDTISSAHKFGISVESAEVDFLKAMSQSWVVDREAAKIEEGVKTNPNIDLYKGRAEFIDEHTIAVGEKEIRGERIVIAAGTRPAVPPIKGLEEVPYMTSREILRINYLPRELAVVGGGYIGVELGNFFRAVGSKVKVLQRRDVLVPHEDKDVARFFTEKFSALHEVFLNFSTEEVEKKGEKVLLHSKDGRVVEATDLLVATGRKPNTDILKVERAGVKVNERGFVVCDQRMRTNKEHIWALGDIVGRYQFKHVANEEAVCVIRNLFGRECEMDYRAVPHAIFSTPQVAGVGKTEQELEGGNYLVGKYNYENTGMGLALKEEGFVKMLCDYEGNILGCHIVGPHASLLIHEVLVSLRSGSGNVKDLLNTIHIHPALNEVVQRAAANI